MKRHPALQDLSRDHHLVLVQCQRVRKALARNAPESGIAALGEEFLRFYHSDMLAHFKEEDDYVVPLAAGRSDALHEAATSVHADHGWLKERFLALQRAEPASAQQILGEIEERLTRHIRLEEEQLFEGVQREVPEADLQAMWTRSYAFRSTHRNPAACTLRPRAPG